MVTGVTGVLGGALRLPMLRALLTRFGRSRYLEGDPGVKLAVSLASRIKRFTRSAKHFLGRLVSSPRSPLYSQTLVSALLPRDFHEKAYSYLHADVRASRMSSAQHFLLYGRGEGRNYFQRYFDVPILVNPISGLHLNRYHAENSLPRSTSPLSHFLLAERPQGPWSLDKVARRGTEANEFYPQSVIHFHCHHFELLDEFLSFVHPAAVGKTTQLVVTFSDQNLADGLASRLSEVDLSWRTLRVANLGRNFGALSTLLGTKELEHIDIWAHFHSKKSPHLSLTLSQNWRLFIYSSLLGPSPDGIGYRDIVSQLGREPDLAIVFPDDPHEFGWGKNFETSLAIARRMSLEIGMRALKFPVGGMFVTKREFVEPLFAAASSFTSQLGEPLPKDGSAWHAFERLLGHVPEEIGMRVAVNRGFDDDYVWLRDSQ